MSALRSPNMNTNAGLAGAAGGGGTSPGGNNNPSGSTGGNVRMGGLRPSSEMLSGYPQSASYLSPNALASAQFASAGLSGGQAGLMKGTPEADAIDKWFEDLQHYEATLEEMAAASLDQNFKEELSAIEQCELCCVLSLSLGCTRLMSDYCLMVNRVPRSVRGGKNGCALQPVAGIDAGADPILHHCSSADGEE
jgi:hypothetical protein